jgi:hypothetical protein
MLVRRRRGGGFLRLDMRGVLQARPRRQTEHLDDSGLAHLVLNAEGVSHGAGDDLKLGLILG